MGNTNLTVDWIGNEALALAHEKAAFIGTINRQFDSTMEPGYGNQIRIRVPSQYTVRTGRVMNVQDGIQQSTQLVVGTTWGVDLRYNSQEISQDLVNFRKLHLEPAMANLISNLDAACISSGTQQTYNQVGTPGVPISTLQFPGLARGRLNQYLAPKDANRRLQFDSVTMSEMVNAFATFQNPSNQISDQYKEGFITRTSMADFYENERVWRMSASADVSSFMSTYTLVEGDTDIVVSAVNAAPTIGQTFTIGLGAAGVFACHPETKQAYTHLQQFTLTGVSTVDGTQTTFQFQPAIRLSGARKNVCGSTGADLVVSSLTTAVVRFDGGPSTTYPIPLMYHRDAFTFATAALPLMDDSIRCVVKTMDGISLRVWEGSDIRNDEKLTRIDILWGFAAIRPQWACRLIGTGV